MTQALIASGILYPGTQGNGRTISRFTTRTALVDLTDGHTKSVIGTAVCYSKAGVLRWRLNLDQCHGPAAQRLREALKTGAQVFTSPHGQPLNTAGDLVGQLEVRSIAVLPATATPALGRSTRITSTWETRAESRHRDEVHAEHHRMAAFNDTEDQRLRQPRYAA